MSKIETLLSELGHVVDQQTDPRTIDTLTEAKLCLELYRSQIRYLLEELQRIGWTPYPSEVPR